MKRGADERQEDVHGADQHRGDDEAESHGLGPAPLAGAAHESGDGYGEEDEGDEHRKDATHHGCLLGTRRTQMRIPASTERPYADADRRSSASIETIMVPSTAHDMSQSGSKAMPGT